MSTCASHLSLRYLCSSFTFSGQESVARACSYAQRTQHFFGQFSSSQIGFFTSSSLLHWNANLGVALSHLQNEWMVYQIQPDHLSLENIWLGFPCFPLQLFQPACNNRNNAGQTTKHWYRTTFIGIGSDAKPAPHQYNHTQSFVGIGVDLNWI